MQNRFVRFVKRPDGAPTPDIFERGSEELAPLKEGEFRLRNAIISIDPAMVSRMRPESNYAESVEPGEVMHSYGIGQVIESKNASVKVGEVHLGRLDMQTYSTMGADHDNRIMNLGIAAPEHYLSVVGITGATAYFTLQQILEPKAGETMLVSSGASSVGRVAAQLAKAKGARLVGIVSSEQKAAGLEAEGVYDRVVSYRDKSVEELAADLAEACPNGIDCYFDNVSGDISEAAMDLYNDYARIAVIGRMGIAHIMDTKKDIGRRDANIMLAHRIKKQGFVLLDYQPRLMEAGLSLARMVRDGSLTAEIDMMEGIENMEEAFFRMLSGQSTGKVMVRLAEIDEAKDPAPRAIGRLLTHPSFPAKPIINLLSKKR